MRQLDWNKTIDSFRQAVPHTQFQNWFKPLTLVRHTDRSVVLGVPSRFHEEWVRSKYSRQISETIHRQVGVQLELQFELYDPEEAVTPQAAATSDENPQKVAPHVRPNLRVVEGDGNSADSTQATPTDFAPGQAIPSEPIELQDAPPPELPVFTTPYWPLEFNLMAHHCAKLVSGEGELPMNPLVIHADVGMGKSHLLAEIGRELYQRNPKCRIQYTNFEAFTSEMVQGFQSNNIFRFRNKFRNDCDVLLFDDVQGLAGRNRSQEELLHIFNDIVAKGGKVVFATKVDPRQLKDFHAPLLSRLTSGLIANIKDPSGEERVQLLRLVCEHNGLILEEPVLRNIASKGQKDIRELLGSAIRLHLQAKIENKPLTAEFVAKETVGQSTQREDVTMDEIITLVETTFGVARDDLMSKSRKSRITWGRQVAMYLARHYTLLPLDDIGKLFGRDHATVIHAFQKVKETMESHPTRRYEVEFLRKKLSARAGNEATS